MRRAAWLLAILALAPGVAQAADDALTGAAKVRGPDTLAVAGTRIRFEGVVPPDENAVCADQSGRRPCLDVAVAALEQLIASGRVSCTKRHRLGHGYFRGRCRTEDGVDPGLALLTRGLLQPDPEGAPPSYLAAAATARNARDGLWGS